MLAMKAVRCLRKNQCVVAGIVVVVMMQHHKAVQHAKPGCRIVSDEVLAKHRRRYWTVCSASSISIVEFTSTESENNWLVPEGHITSTLSTDWASPKPKYKGYKL